MRRGGKVQVRAQRSTDEPPQVPLRTWCDHSTMCCTTTFPWTSMALSWASFVLSLLAMAPALALTLDELALALASLVLVLVALFVALVSLLLAPVPMPGRQAGWLAGWTMLYVLV